ncbi:hypothetical protein V6N13_098387 [Hibiscus sabdariffa]|uniref:Uncharacterized protein n=1 Tax=Hibiscus sabdariffa TaxID=183260 RepID=A0ABR2EE08_9ROSI
MKGSERKREENAGEDGGSSSKRARLSDPREVQEAVPPSPQHVVPPPPPQPVIPHQPLESSDDESYDEWDDKNIMEDLGSYDSFGTKDYPNNPNTTDSDSNNEI